MGKITSYPAATAFDSSADVILKDGTNGTKKMAAQNLMIEICKMTWGMTHRSIYRGKNHGTSVTSEQLAMIRDGSFKDFFPGDYWEINGHRYEVADLDYWRNRQDTYTTDIPHHLAIIGPVISNPKIVMNDTADNSGGYLGSKLYTEGLDPVRDIIRTDFGSTLLTIKRQFSSHATDGVVDAQQWVDCTAELMNEPMMFGHRIYSKEIAAASSETAQLALFNLRTTGLHGYSVWLCDPTTAGPGKGFCLRLGINKPGYSGANVENSTMCVFAIGTAS